MEINMSDENVEVRRNILDVKGSAWLDEKGVYENIFNLLSFLSAIFCCWRSNVYGEDYAGFMVFTVFVYSVFMLFLIPFFLNRKIEFDEDTNELTVERAGNFRPTDLIDLSKVTFAKCLKARPAGSVFTVRYYIVLKTDNDKNYFEQTFSKKSNIEEIVSFINKGLEKANNNLSLSVPETITAAKDFKSEIGTEA